VKKEIKPPPTGVKNFLKIVRPRRNGAEVVLRDVSLDGELVLAGGALQPLHLRYHYWLRHLDHCAAEFDLEAGLPDFSRYNIPKR
jgi:hypothetical protein